MKLTLSIVILNWNTSGLLRNCIKSIQEFTTSLDYEIIVVDNGSSDGSQTMLRREFPEVKLIETGENLGFAKGNNMGIRTAKGDFILVLNSDTYILENAFQPWVEFLQSKQDAAGAICKTEGIDGERQISFVRFPTIFSEWLFFSTVMLSPWPLMIPRSKYMLDADPAKVHVVDRIYGHAMMLRKEVIDKTGAFDEGIFLFYEDTELCYRIRKLTGKVFYYFPGSRIVHIHGGSYIPNSLWQIQFSFRSACYFFNKTAGIRVARTFRNATRFSWVLTVFVLGFMNLATFGRIPRLKRKVGFYINMLRIRASCLSGII